MKQENFYDGAMMETTLPVETEKGLLYAFVLDGKGGAKAFSDVETAEKERGAGVLWLCWLKNAPETRRWIDEKSGFDEQILDLLANEDRPRCMAFGDTLLLLLRTVNMAAGAEAAVVSRFQDDVPADRQIIVADTQKALEDMAVFARARTKAKIVGVTGSSGKTSTKEMLRHALGAVGVTHYTQGNLNNGIGMPLTLARLPKDADFAVVEMGMNHAGELTALSDLCRPDAVIVTMIGRAHCEFFKDERATAAAKAEIFTHMNKKGFVLLNKDDAQFDFLKEKAASFGVKNILSFGQKDDCDVKALSLTPETVVETKKGRYAYRLHLAGEHQARNSLAVVGVCERFGVDMTDAVSGLAQTPAPDAARKQTFRLKAASSPFWTIRTTRTPIP